MSDSLRPHRLSACQAPLFMGISRQEYWNGLPCLPPGDLPNPGIKPRSPALQADSLPAEPQGQESGSEITQSCLTLVTPWIVAYKVSPSMEFSKQEYWSVLSFPSPGDLPDPGIEPGSLASWQMLLPSKPRGKLPKSKGKSQILE